MEKIPKAIGPYSAFRREGPLLLTSGQLPINPVTSQIDSENIKAQVKQALENLKAIIHLNGGSLENLLKVTVLLVDLNDFNAVNQVFEEFFSIPYPARTAYEVSKLPMGAKVEIEGIVYLDEEIRLSAN
ncbi:RidA family protein [Vagococcus allomyrinae]|uniref:RidA family protein n=1 Tax=Vagococcus allomyrinae TaxID=2794353 RepID=UPI00322205FC